MTAKELYDKIKEITEDESELESTPRRLILR